MSPNEHDSRTRQDSPTRPKSWNVLIFNQIRPSQLPSYWLFPFNAGKKPSPTRYRTELLRWANLILNTAIIELYPHRGTHLPAISGRLELTPDNILETLSDHRIGWEIGNDRPMRDKHGDIIRRTLSNLDETRTVLIGWWIGIAKKHGDEIRSLNGFEHRITTKTVLTDWQRVWWRAWELWDIYHKDATKLHNAFDKMTNPIRKSRMQIGTKVFQIDQKVKGDNDWIYDWTKDDVDWDKTRELRKSRVKPLPKGGRVFAVRRYKPHECDSSCTENYLICPRRDKPEGELHDCNVDLDCKYVKTDNGGRRCIRVGKIRPQVSYRVVTLDRDNTPRLDRIIESDQLEPEETSRAKTYEELAQDKESEIDDLFKKMARSFYEV